MFTSSFAKAKVLGEFPLPKGSKCLLRRYLDRLLPPKSHPHEVLGPSGLVSFLMGVMWESRMPILGPDRHRLGMLGGPPLWRGGRTLSRSTFGYSGLRILDLSEKGITRSTPSALMWFSRNSS